MRLRDFAQIYLADLFLWMGFKEMPVTAWVECEV